MIEIRWNPSFKDLRGFGFVILIGFGVIGLAKAFWPFAWGLAPNFHYGCILLLVAALVGVPAILGWRVVLPAYWAWMGFAFVLHKITFPLMFGVFYYLAFLPTGLIMRLVGHDPLLLKRKNRATYWVSLNTDEKLVDYERQY